LSQNLSALSPKLNQALELLKIAPTQLILRGQSKLLESPSHLTPLLFIVVPQVQTAQFAVELEKEPPGRVIFLDSILAILDEIYEVDHLSEFHDYLETLEKSFMPSMISMLDKFASFVASHGLLVGGASEPDIVMLDPHWGSRHRYESLAKFWGLYPEKDFFGHPRSWRVQQEGQSRVRLIARSFFGSALHCKIGQVHAFFTCPYHEMP
jgi:hypothetical protein